MKTESRTGEAPFSEERRSPYNFPPYREKSVRASIVRGRRKSKGHIDSELLRKLDQLSYLYHNTEDSLQKGIIGHYLEQLEYDIQRDTRERLNEP